MNFEPMSSRLGEFFPASRGTALAALPDGRILLLYDCEAARKDGTNGKAIISQESVDGGCSWGPPQLVVISEEHWTHCPTAHVDAAGRVHVVYNGFYGFDWNHQGAENRSDTMYITSDDGRSWSQPRRTETNHAYMGAHRGMMGLRSGRLLFGICYFEDNGFLVTTMSSDDGGATWQRSRSSLNVGRDTRTQTLETGATEPVMIELNDGRVWMLIRTTLGRLYQSFSTDGGDNWTEPQPSQIISSNTHAYLLRLRDGRIALAWNHSNTHTYGREVLTVALSADEGTTFTGYREVMRIAPSMGPDWKPCYPQMAQAPDGSLLLSYWIQQGQSLDFGLQNLSDTVGVVRIAPQWLDEMELVESFDCGLTNFSYAGTAGVSLSCEGEKHLTLTRQPDAEVAAVRNFPALRAGRLQFQCRSGAGVLDLRLAQSFLSPGNAERASGAIMETLRGLEDWTAVEVAWNCAAGTYSLTVGGTTRDGELTSDSALLSYVRFAATEGTVQIKGIRTSASQS